MRLFKTQEGPLIEARGRYYWLHGIGWDEMINRDDLPAFLDGAVRRGTALPDGFRPEQGGLLVPIGSQEVWAAGVTYYRSRDARMEESREAGGGDLYDRVYSAARPELFFKASPSRVVGHLGRVRIRRDSRWMVPEPELTLVLNASGRIVGYTAGNDMSARDIEGENPLYLPQAKIFEGSCSLGPGILVREEDLPPETRIDLTVIRRGESAFAGGATMGQMKRAPGELVDYLYRELRFPSGCYLMTGTGIVPPPEFSLQSGDEIRIRVESIGALTNFVA